MNGVPIVETQVARLSIPKSMESALSLLRFKVSSDTSYTYWILKIFPLLQGKIRTSFIVTSLNLVGNGIVISFISGCKALKARLIGIYKKPFFTAIAFVDNIRLNMPPFLR